MCCRVPNPGKPHLQQPFRNISIWFPLTLTQKQPSLNDLLLLSSDSGHLSILILLDHTAAFDTITTPFFSPASNPPSTLLVLSSPSVHQHQQLQLLHRSSVTRRRPGFCAWFSPVHPLHAPIGNIICRRGLHFQLH